MGNVRFTVYIFKVFNAFQVRRLSSFGKAFVFLVASGPNAKGGSGKRAEITGGMYGETTPPVLVFWTFVLLWV